MTKGLSVVLPAYENGDALCARLPSLRRALEPLFPAIELIVVDDGSFLDSEAILRVVPGVRLFRNRGNLGKGASTLLGLQASRHSKVLFTDADIPFDPESYARVGEALSRGTPAVIGCRRRPESRMLVRFDALSYMARRHVVGLQFNRMVRWLTRLPYRDTQCGLKAFDRELALALFRHVRESRFLFDVELLVAARLRGVEILEVPVCVIYDDSRSTIQVGIDGWQMARGLLRVWWRLLRGGYRLEPGTALLDQLGGLSQEVGPSASPGLG